MTTRALGHAKQRSPLAAVLLATALVAGCDVPFEPFQVNTVGPFSLFGYLDLTADTQWIRVTPIRQNLLPDAAPIDAVVTLEHVGTGRVVTLRDSVFTFADPRLDTIGFAHNFWTAEPLVPEATYRLTATRSDGAATTALVEMPPDLAVSIVYFNITRTAIWEPRQAFVDAPQLLYSDVIYAVFDPRIGRGGTPVVVRNQPAITRPEGPGFLLPGTGPFSRLDMPPLIDVARRDARFVLAGPDWPYVPGLSAIEIAIPGVVPTTVENGIGSVQGVTTRTIPLALCMPADSALGDQYCARSVDPSSASITGTVRRAPCSNPRLLANLLLTEQFADGVVVNWQLPTDFNGGYSFVGLRPDSRFELLVAGDSSVPINIPPLDPGEHFTAPDVTVPVGCVSGG